MKKKELFHGVLVVLVLLGIYFLTRFIAIRTLPPFNDEFIYVRWAQQGFFDPAMRLISLRDGKQPLYIWLVSLMMNMIPSPLAAGRIVSTLAGAMTMIGVGVLSYQLYKSRVISLAASVLYILAPQALLLDRFALYDSLLGALCTWSMIVMNSMIGRPTLGASLVLAFMLGAALLVKSSALFLFVLLPIGALIFSKTTRRKIHVAGLFVVTVVVALLYQSVQFLSASSSFIAEKNATFIYTLDQLRTLPIIPHLTENLRLYTHWVLSYVPLPLIALAISTWIIDRKHFKAHLFLTLAVLIPFLSIVLVGKTVYPRHLFFLSIPLLILAGAGAGRILTSRLPMWTRVAILFLCALPILYMSSRIVIDYKSAPLPAMDRFQYIEGWPAGWGVKDIARYLEDKSAKGSLTILTEGIYGSMPTTAMYLYFGQYPQVHILPIDDTTFLIPRDVDWTQDVYVILNRAQELPGGWNAEEVMKVRKGNADSYIRLLKLRQPKQASGFPDKR